MHSRNITDEIINIINQNPFNGFRFRNCGLHISTTTVLEKYIPVHLKLAKNKSRKEIEAKNNMTFLGKINSKKFWSKMELRKFRSNLSDG